MAQVALKLNMTQMTAAVRQLRERAPVASARALNRAAGSAKTVMVRGVAGDVGLKQATVRDQMTILEARPSMLVARLSISGKRIPIIDFGASGPEPSRGRGRGVRSRLKGGAKLLPHAFIATMRSGHRGVFMRVGKARLKIRELLGPSLPHVFSKYATQGLARGQEALAKNLQSELKYELSQISKSA